MEALDADKEPLYSGSYRRYALRDVVQFVPFSDYHGDPAALTQAVLKEVPK